MAEDAETSAPTLSRYRGLQPWPKGVSGNPGGRSPVVRDLQVLAQQHTVAAIQTLVEIMTDQSATAAARAYCANSILDRGYGKPMSAPEPETVEGRDALTVGELRVRAQALLVKAAGG